MEGGGLHEQWVRGWIIEDGHGGMMGCGVTCCVEERMGGTDGWLRRTVGERRFGRK